MINELNLVELKEKFFNAEPFNHVVIDNFFQENIANEIANNFADHHDDSFWTVRYDNFVEKKKACSHWDKFPAPVYNALYFLCSADFTKLLSLITGNDSIFADYGLHGGGMHSHGIGGKLNIHKDYSLHPKIPFMRNYNLIIYMTPNWNDSWGGGLELWSNDDEFSLPKERVTYISNKFNRAVLFDTTQNSWHGLPEALTCPENTARKSLATYYVTPISDRAENRKRAFYAPYKNQKNDPEIVEFCKKRSGL